MLDELVGIIGVSKGMFLQIEKGIINFIINIIWKISNGFNVLYMYLLEDDYVKENFVVKKIEMVI